MSSNHYIICHFLEYVGHIFYSLKLNHKKQISDKFVSSLSIICDSERCLLFSPQLVPKVSIIQNEGVLHSRRELCRYWNWNTFFCITHFLVNYCNEINHWYFQESMYQSWLNTSMIGTRTPLSILISRVFWYGPT